MTDVLYLNAVIVSIRVMTRCGKDAIAKKESQQCGLCDIFHNVFHVSLSIFVNLQ
jgi:hypothetical protein